MLQNLKIYSLSLLIGVMVSATANGSKAAMVSPGTRQQGGLNSIVLHPVTEGGKGWIRPRTMPLTKDRPKELKKLPANLVAPMFGALDLADGRYVVVRDVLPGGDVALYVDTNADGDLTNDPPVKLEKQSVKDNQGKMINVWRGTIFVKAIFGPGAHPVNFGLLPFTPFGPAPSNNQLYYFANYFLEGTITLKGKRYKTWLKDLDGIGSFAKPKVKSDPRDFPKLYLWIDINGDDRIETVEQMDATLPFNIGGTTYQLEGFTRDGSQVRVVKSRVKVPERKPQAADPYRPVTGKPLVGGQKAPAFTALTMSGKTIDLATSYKGKIVMLDFWATWCGPCMQQVPYIAAAYKELHSQGLEILGVPDETSSSVPRLKPTIKATNMIWDQVSQANEMPSRLMQKYSISEIPYPLLIDGDTMTILAAGDDLYGELLLKVVKKALEDKKAKAQGAQQ